MADREHYYTLVCSTTGEFIEWTHNKKDAIESWSQHNSKGEGYAETLDLVPIHSGERIITAKELKSIMMLAFHCKRFRGSGGDIGDAWDQLPSWMQEACGVEVKCG